MGRMLFISVFLAVCVSAVGLGANVTVVDYFTTTDTLFGLYSDSYHIWGVDTIGDELEGYYFDGTPYATIPIDYGTHPYPWGVCLIPGGSTYYTDFTSNYIHYFDGASWYQYIDPAGLYGRGLDYDGEFFWEADCDYDGNGNGIYRFNTDGTGAMFYATPEPRHYLTGLTRFSFDSTEYVMITTNQDLNFYFYEIDGTYAGSAPVPFTLTYGYGLEYCSGRDNFFYSCVSYGNCCIYELDFDFYTGIADNSFGELKALFR
jgi:hypothetical protein